MTKWILPMLLIVSPLPAAAQKDADPINGASTWSAREVPAELVDSIINGNMFMPDLRREPRVELSPGDAVSDEMRAEDPPAPQPVYSADDPDRRFRLIGSSFAGGRWLAFIENNETGEVHRVAVEEPIASGTITAIDYNRIEYVANDESRTVLIGRDLTGAEPPTTLESDLSSLFESDTPSVQTAVSPRADTSSNTPNTLATDPSDAEARRAEVLRRLRERRERESQ